MYYRRYRSNVAERFFCTGRSLSAISERISDLKRDGKRLIARQAKYVHIDPYANAFNEEDNGNCWEKDLTKYNPWNWERKYEIDSLCYPIWLIKQYVENSGARDVFTPEVKQAFRDILDVWQTEQYHENSEYSFIRLNCPPSDTLSNDGKGAPVATPV